MSGRWQHRATRQVFASPRIQVFEDVVVQPDGSEGRYTVLEEPSGSVTVVAVGRDQRIVFVEQHRYPLDAVLLELPGGQLPPGHSPLSQATRELFEETGITAEQVRELGEFVPWAARARRRCLAVLATGLDTAGMAVSHQLGNESIHAVHLYPDAEVRRKIAAGEIIDGNTLSALSLYWAKRGRAEV
jgi:ADP-ribose pyrophosphatase